MNKCRILTVEFRAIQVGGRNMWRIGANDVEDYIAGAYKRSAERIAAGDLRECGPKLIQSSSPSPGIIIPCQLPVPSAAPGNH
jgi:hypothetical protein